MPQGEVSLVGQPTVTLDDFILTSFADGNYFEITFEDDLGQAKVGKNGNTIYAQNVQGKKASVVLRLLKGSTDDKYLNGRLAEWLADASIFRLMTGIFVQRVGDGQGNIESNIYNCTGGFFRRQVDAHGSAEADIEQGVSVWRLQFGDASVSIQ